MKIKVPIITACFFALLCVIFYSCKKNQDPLNTDQEKYKNLPADVSVIAKWYDKQISESEKDEFVRQNTPNWNETIKLKSTSGGIIYAAQLFTTKSVKRELNINKSDEDSFFGIIKEYELNSETGLVALKIYSLTGQLIEEGILKENGNYVRLQKRRLNTMKSMGLPDGKEIGIDEDGEPIVVIGGAGPKNIFINFPSGPSFPSGPGGPSRSTPEVYEPVGTPNPGTDIISGLKDYPCADGLVKALPTLKNDIAGLIKKTFGLNDKVDLVFEPKVFTDKSIDGKLVSYTTANYVVGISTDVLNKSSKEYILVTLYHEALHAYFDRSYRILGEIEFKKQFKGIDVNGGRLFAQDIEHSEMGYQKYVSGLKDAILSFNPKFGEARAKALAEAGIIKLSPENAKINAQEKDTTDPINNPGFQGTKCP